MKDILILIGLTGMCYSFLWIDAKPVIAILGMIAGLALFVLGNAKESESNRSDRTSFS